MDRPTGNKSLLWLLLLAFAVLLGVMPALCAEMTQDSAADEEYTLDPSITGGVNAPYRPEQGPPVKVESKGNQTTLQLETEGRVSPYVGTIKKEKIPEDLRHLLPAEEQAPFENYRLETGVGVNVGKNTDFNLGYRFERPPTLLDRSGPDSSEQSGQFRFGLDFKLPSK